MTNYEKINFSQLCKKLFSIASGMADAFNHDRIVSNVYCAMEFYRENRYINIDASPFYIALHKRGAVYGDKASCISWCKGFTYKDETYNTLRYPVCIIRIDVDDEGFYYMKIKFTSAWLRDEINNVNEELNNDFNAL